MKQHAVPQNITSYEFQLVGSMTLKQFAFLAGPVLLAVLAYFLPLMAYIKWPLILLLVLLGVGLAFVPINDVPLDRWITAFFRAVTSPTIYVYQKKGRHLGYMDFQPRGTAKKAGKVPIDKVTIAEYLKTLPGEGAQSDRNHDQDRAQIDKINNLFGSVNISVGEVEIKQKRVVGESQTVVIDSKHDRLAGRSLPGEGDELIQVNLGGQVRVVPKLTSVRVRRLGAQPVGSADGSRTVKPTPPTPVKVRPAPAKPVNPVIKTVPKRPARAVPDVMASLNKKKATKVGSQKVVSQSARVQVSLPAAPTVPNIITGVVVDEANKLVEGAIVEVKTAMTDQIVRVMKTNKLGRFWLATPLQTGKYNLIVESEGKNFAIIPFEVKGEIIKPFKIAAHA